MRLVAIVAILAVLNLGGFSAADPLSTHDDCPDSLMTTTKCLRYEMPPGSPEQVLAKTGRYVYIWLGAANCAPTASGYTDCVRDPAAGRKNSVTGGNAFAGVIFGDTNGAPGLQRHGIYISGVLRQPDMTLLL